MGLRERLAVPWASRVFVDKLLLQVKLRSWSEEGAREATIAHAAAQLIPARVGVVDAESRPPALCGRVMMWRPMVDAKSAAHVWADDGRWHVTLHLPWLAGRMPGDERAGTRYDVTVELHALPLAELGWMRASAEALQWAAQLGDIESVSIGRLDLAVDTWLPPGEWGSHLVRGIVAKTAKLEPTYCGRDDTLPKHLRTWFDRATLELESWAHGSSRSGFRQTSYDKLREYRRTGKPAALVRWAQLGWAGVTPEAQLREEVKELDAEGWRMIRHEFQLRTAWLRRLVAPGARGVTVYADSLGNPKAEATSSADTMADFGCFCYHGGVERIWRRLVGSPRRHGAMRVVDVGTSTRKKRAKLALTWQLAQAAVPMPEDSSTEGWTDRAHVVERRASVGERQAKVSIGYLASLAARLGVESVDELKAQLEDPVVTAELSRVLARKRIENQSAHGAGGTLRDALGGCLGARKVDPNAARVTEGGEWTTSDVRMAAKLRNAQRATNARQLAEAAAKRGGGSTYLPFEKPLRLTSQGDAPRMKSG